MKNDFVFPQTNSGDENFNRTGGLTKREWFAGMALSNPEITKHATGGIMGIHIICYGIADKMIERERETARQD